MLASLKKKTKSKRKERDFTNHRALDTAQSQRSSEKMRSHRAESEPVSSSPPKPRKRRIRATSADPGQSKPVTRKRLRRPNEVHGSHSGNFIDLSDSPPLGCGKDDPVPRDVREPRGVTHHHTESDDRSDSSEAGEEGESPDRPFYADDKFNLKGSRKKAAFASMPAFYVKRAIRDLQAMQQEKKAGKRVREVMRDPGSGEEEQENPARAKVRVNMDNASRPIRFIVENPTSDSDNNDNSMEESEDEREAEAAAAWANVEPVKKPRMTSAVAGKRYWEEIIGHILLRDKLDRQAGQQLPKRKRKRKTDGMKSVSDRTHQLMEGSRDKAVSDPKKSRKQQKRMDQYSYYIPPVVLDDTDALFAAMPQPSLMSQFQRKQQNPFRRSTLNIEITTLPDSFPGRPPLSGLGRTEIIPGQAVNAIQTDVWAGEGAAFSRFSFDFNIKRLPPGLTFSPSSYIGKGYLRELASLASQSGVQTTGRRPCAPFGIKLDIDIGADDFLSMLPRLCEKTFEEIASMQSSIGLNTPAGETLRFCAHYMYEQSSSAANGRPIIASILAELANLEARLDTWLTSSSTVQQKMLLATLSFKWYMFEIAYRSDLIGRRSEVLTIDQEASKSHLLERLSEVTQILVTTGFGRTVKALKSMLTLTLEESGHVEDLQGEIWVCIIHLCSTSHEGQPSILSHSTLWQLVESHLKTDAAVRSLHPILAGEVASYAAMALSSLSQFSIYGLSSSLPRLACYWPLILTIIDQIRVKEFPDSYTAMNNTSRTRASRYIWTIYARCLVLSSRWQWALLEQGKLVGKLFDILNSRELQDLSIDGESGFPSFVSDYTGQIGSEVEGDDTAFQLFLRILAQAAAEAERDGTKKARDLLGRISMRVMPMRERIPYSRLPSATTLRKHRSVLVNHYSLFVLLAAIDPSTSEKRFPRLKSILDFPEADSKARQDCLKAILYLGIVYRVKQINLSGLVFWLSELADYLKERYINLAKRRISTQQPLQDRTNLHNQKLVTNTVAVGKQTSMDKQTELAKINRDMSEVALLTGLLLGSVQQLMRTAPEAPRPHGQPTYPTLAFLHACACRKLACKCQLLML